VTKVSGRSSSTRTSATMIVRAEYLKSGQVKPKSRRHSRLRPLRRRFGTSSRTARSDACSKLTVDPAANAKRLGIFNGVGCDELRAKRQEAVQHLPNHPLTRGQWAPRAERSLAQQ
jgi:hypothetical protein